MKRILQSKLITDYGMVLVLLLLGMLISWVTWDEQHPEDPGAGRSLARDMIEAMGDDAQIAIVLRQTSGDRKYAAAISEELERLGVTVAATIHAKTPREARVELEELGTQGIIINAIATHDFCFKTWGVIRQSSLDALAVEYPSFTGIKAYKPKSYMWPTFLTRKNLVSILNQNAPVAIMAIGMTFVIITAGIDLSVGSLMALAALISAVTIRDWLGGAEASGLGVYTAFGIAITVCMMSGVFVGLMITWFQMPPFVVTLALMMVARGSAFILAGGADSVDVAAAGTASLYSGAILGVPNQIMLMLVLYGLAHVVMSHTALGRYVYAVGGNPQAARLSGVPVFWVIILAYAICGAAAGLAGVMDVSHFTSGRPKAGEFYELQVIAAVVVGGTSLMGGEGKIFGTFIGAMILGVIQNGLNMQGVDSYRANVVYGALILAAVLVDQLKRKFFKPVSS
jgi:ribose transport system permease protein